MDNVPVYLSKRTTMTLRAKRITIWGLLLVAVAVLAIPKLVGNSSADKGTGSSARGGAGSGGGKKGGSGSGGGKGGAVPVRVAVMAITKLDNRMRVNGTVLAGEQIDLQSEISGKVIAIYFREGESVGRGKLLLKLNDSELQAQLQRAQYRRDLAVSKEQRQRQLLDKKAISPADFDVAENELNTANAEIELVQAQIAKTEVRAPFAGMVGLRNISLGSYLTPTTKIATLTSTNPVKVDFFVPERYYSAVRPGSRVTFTVDGNTSTISGRVFAVEPRIEQSTRTLQVRALVSNPEGRLLPGAFAEVDVTLDRVESAVAVPSQALVPQPGGGMSVFLAHNGKAESRLVKIGLRTDRLVQVISGLSLGDSVISSGVQMVKPGTDVKITGVDDPSASSPQPDAK